MFNLVLMVHMMRREWHHENSYNPAQIERLQKAGYINHKFEITHKGRNNATES